MKQCDLCHGSTNVSGEPQPTLEVNFGHRQRYWAALVVLPRSPSLLTLLYHIYPAARSLPIFLRTGTLHCKIIFERSFYLVICPNHRNILFTIGKTTSNGPMYVWILMGSTQLVTCCIGYYAYYAYYAYYYVIVLIILCRSTIGEHVYLEQNMIICSLLRWRRQRRLDALSNFR